MNNTFDDFVRQQIATSTDGGNGLDLEQEKSMWLEKLDQLYELIRDSLSQYIVDGSIRLEMEDVALHEEQLGTYLAKSARIMIGRQVVLLNPVGTFLIGSRGRVDMDGPRGKVLFTIVPPDANAPKVRVTVSLNGIPPAHQSQEQSAPPETWVWKIATPPPRITYIELNQDSFRAALMGVVNG
jgi:hypothetical protein